MNTYTCMCSSRECQSQPLLQLGQLCLRLDFANIAPNAQGCTWLHSYKCTSMQLPNGIVLLQINLMAEYLESKHQTFCAVRLRNVLPKRMHMAWRDTTNSVDSGVLAMRHIESYTGQDCNEWNCGLQRGNAEQVLNLCKRFMHNILLSEVNSHMHTIANCVGQYDRQRLADISR